MEDKLTALRKQVTMGKRLAELAAEMLELAERMESEVECEILELESAQDCHSPSPESGQPCVGPPRSS